MFCHSPLIRHADLPPTRRLNTARNSPDFRGFRGFTLVELLVVISIIGLLVALLIPALSSARTMSQMAMSMTNLQQLGIAHQQYANDNKWVLMHSQYNEAGTTSHRRPTWGAFLERAGYVQVRSVFWGPARDTSALAMNATNYTSGDPWQYTGYGMNIWIGPPVFGANGQPNFHLDAGNTPAHSTAVLMAETSTNALGTDVKFAGFYQALSSLSASTNYNLFTYNGNATPHAYIDGHVSSSPAALGYTPIDQIYGKWKYTSVNHRKGPPWHYNWWQ